MATTNEEKLRWLPILLEAFIVVLGVVLALAVNEWREDYNRNQHAEIALEGIVSELDVNRKAIDSALTYHLQLGDTLRDFMRQASQGALPYPDGRLFSKGYIAPATLLNTAWDAANATDAVTYMNYADVLMLSRIYEEQRNYEYQARLGGQLIYAKLFSEGHEGMVRNYANLSTIIATFWYIECGLLESYGQVLAQLGEASKPEVDELPALCQQVLRR